MTHEHKRCHHCAVTYAYQGSGHGCMEPTNDPDYCPDCKKVILDALSSVPARRKKDWVVTRDVSVETLVKREADGVAKVRAEGGFAVTRVPMGLYDLRDPSNHNRGGVLRVDGRTLKYDYWTKAGMDAGVVSVEVERDAVTGEVLGPWELTDNWHRNGVKPPTLDLDADPYAQCPESENEVTLEVKPLMARDLSSVFFMQSFPMIESNSLSDLRPVDDQVFLANMEPLTQIKDERREHIVELVQSLKHTRDYGRKTLVVEPLPDGALPHYDVPEDTGVSKDPAEPGEE